jgi:protein-tyrosine kinase
MSKIFEALQKAEQEQRPRETVEHVSAARKIDLETRLPDKLVTLKMPGSVAAEQFRFLRSQIIRPQTGEPPKTILISSSLPGEGKTFTACNLAVSIAQGLDEQVLLVDADLRNPNVHNMFGLDRPQKGLGAHLKNDEPLSGLLRKTFLDKLTILPAGQETENPAELLSSQRMQDFIAKERERHPNRRIIFDSSPIILAPETLMIAGEVDAVFLVVLWGKTSRSRARTAQESLKEGKLKGIIFNQDPEVVRKKSYHYGYGYGGSGYTVKR